MNARCTLIVLLISACNLLQARGSIKVPEEKYPIKRFSLSVNPAGILFYGPMIHGEVSLGDHVRIDAHVRFTGLGLGYKVYNSPDQIATIPSPGAGILYFFRKGHVCPYLGVLAEYDHQIHTIYEPYGGPEITKIYDIGILGLGAGCRFRFSNGFFMGTGGYVFYSLGHYTGTSSWYDQTYNGSYQQDRPRVQVDFRLGFEFGLR